MTQTGSPEEGPRGGAFRRSWSDAAGDLR